MNKWINQGQDPDDQPVGFASTVWGQVLAAGDDQASDHDTALQSLCERYWPPVYAFLRRKGHSQEVAKDLTQAFFEFLLQHHTLARADPARGRFRSFLLTVLKNFLKTQARHEARVHRNAVRPFLSWEGDEVEKMCKNVLVHADTPEKAFERRWALDLLERAMSRFRLHFQHLAESEVLPKLIPHLCVEPEAIPYDTLAREMHVSAGTLRVTIHRMRKKYRDLLREEILATGVPNSEVGDEISHLVEILQA